MIVLHLARSAAPHKCHTDKEWQTRNRPTQLRGPPSPTRRPLRLDLLQSNRTDLHLEGDRFRCRFVHRLFSHMNFRTFSFFQEKYQDSIRPPKKLFQLLTQSRLPRTLMFFFFLTIDAVLLARSQYSEGPATGHLDTGFSWFPCA